MSDTRLHSRSFDLRYYEMDKRGEATPVTLISLLEESAFSHCEASGWGVYRLLGEGLGWVLLRGALEMRRYPAYREGFRVETWLSGARRFYGTREYRVVADSGEELGYARSLWAFFGLERKRPVPILGEILEAWAPGGSPAGPAELDEVEGPQAARWPDALRDLSFDVRSSEIDTNGHVNNVNYLAWALESLPEEARAERFLSSIRGQYKREVTLGSAVRPLALPEGEGFVHGVYATPAGGGPAYLAAAASSSWKPYPAAAAAACGRGFRAPAA